MENVTLQAEDRGRVEAIRASLGAKLERQLRRPVVATVVRGPVPVPVEDLDDTGLPDLFRELQTAARAAAPAQGTRGRSNPWREDPADGTCTVRVDIDYDDLWRGCEREVLEAVQGTVESHVAFLTEEQKRLLERSPREFLSLNPRPETAELVTFSREIVGGSERVAELVLAEPPKSPDHIRYIAVVPNLVPLERQLDALVTLERATDDGPLAPLRALVGLGDARALPRPAPVLVHAPAASSDRLDTFQAECVEKALTTPHFAVVRGPPGSGKTTVISTIIRRALERGERVLVVSPTHVAVDNVVEKLTPRRGAKEADPLERRTLPVRFAARPKKLLDAASAYWIGPKAERRGATLARRVERRLSATLPLAAALYARVDEDAAGHAPLTAALAGVHSVLCGTPIGLLSFDPVKAAEPGSFDLLVVDEVSKMTLPEFLAVAVKARRWLLVGDPAQLPPYNSGEENGTTLDDLVAPHLELVCSVGAILERAKPALRRDQRVVVVSTAPARVAEAIRAHVAQVGLDPAPAVAVLDEATTAGVVVCGPTEVDAACAFLAPARGRDRMHDPAHHGSVSLLVERGVAVPRPAVASGVRLVEPRMRAPALLFDNAFSVYHAQPWTARADQKLALVRFRNGIDKYLPSAAALAALDPGTGPDAEAIRAALVDAVAERYAINAVSVYDWLTGLPTEHFDVSPLVELATVAEPLAPLRDAVAPFVGTLRKQYRMHASLSKVPRELFYFGEALEDGAPDAHPGCRVRLLQVAGGGADGETNEAEVRAICDMLARLNAGDAAKKRRAGLLAITPYRAQERRLAEAIDALRDRGELANLDVEVCTLDRCQGREAEYVFVSLVRGRATPFLDAPKRWNVALTRAMEGLFVFGDVDAYLREARAARRAVVEKPWFGRPLMSLLARILEAYDQQISGLPAATRKE